jgi:hypothetical protein
MPWGYKTSNMQSKNYYKKEEFWDYFGTVQWLRHLLKRWDMWGISYHKGHFIKVEADIKPYWSRVLINFSNSNFWVLINAVHTLLIICVTFALKKYFPLIFTNPES